MTAALVYDASPVRIDSQPIGTYLPTLSRYRAAATDDGRLQLIELDRGGVTLHNLTYDPARSKLPPIGSSGLPAVFEVPQGTLWLVPTTACCGSGALLAVSQPFADEGPATVAGS